MVGNWQILQWDLKSKINILRNRDKRYTPISPPKRFAKFGWQTRTFCQKKVKMAVAKLGADRRKLAKHSQQKAAYSMCTDRFP